MEFFHSLPDGNLRPCIFGMNATPVKENNASSKHANFLGAIISLETTMDGTLVTVYNQYQTMVETLVPCPDEFVLLYIPYSYRTDDEDSLPLEHNFDRNIHVTVPVKSILANAIREEHMTMTATEVHFHNCLPGVIKIA